MTKTRTSLKNKADKLWKQAVWAEFDDKCAVCGKECRNSHHIVGRINYRLRWERLNGINLCPSHHTFDSKFSAHGTPTLFTDWLKEHYPERYEYTKKYINELWDKDYDRIIKELEAL